MKYRTKLLVLFIVTALFTSGISLALLYHQSKQYLLEQMRSTLYSIASTAAAIMDVPKHEAIKSRPDEKSANYKEVEAFLRKMRDVNRRPDVYVKFIYTIRPGSAQTTNAPVFVVDAEEEGPDKSHVGDVYNFKEMDKYPPDFQAPQIIPIFIRDQWGLWLTGTVPLRDAAGKPVGLLGVDIDAREVNAKLQRVVYSGLMSMLVSVLLAVAFAWVLSHRVSEPLTQIRAAVEAIGQGKLDTKVALATKDEFAEVGNAINAMVLGLRQRDNLKSTLVSYVSQQVADEILASGQLPSIKGERRRITVLFADVRGFTTLSEKLQPEEIVALLNEYFDHMIEAIFRHQGALNKFIGDGLMAMFGAPVDDPRHEENAILAALEMQTELRLLQAKFRKERALDFRIGIGINTGEAVVGNIGSQQKMEYTAIGDTVNTASRLETKTKELNADILVSESTYAAVRDRFRFKDHGAVQVKGKAMAIQVYAVEGVVATPATNEPVRRT
jgi:adenylate cyclase